MTNTLTRGATDRLISLDVFRGLTIAGMLIVNNPDHGATSTGRWHMRSGIDVDTIPTEDIH